LLKSRQIRLAFFFSASTSPPIWFFPFSFYFYPPSPVGGYAQIMVFSIINQMVPAITLFHHLFPLLIILFPDLLPAAVCQLCPAAYGMSSPPPDRTVILPTIILCVYVSIAGFLVGNELLSYRFWENYLRPLFSQSSGFFSFFAAFTFQVTTRVLAVSNDYQRFAAVFDRLTV
jgi:hypothetical protein